MKRPLLFLYFLAVLPLFANVHPMNQTSPNGEPLLVPSVQKYQARPGELALPETIIITAPESESIIVEQLAKDLKFYHDISAVGGNNGLFQFILTDKGVPSNKEGYSLEITSKCVNITANSGAGLFYGAQTLRNLISRARTAEFKCCSITDWPDFEERGYFFSFKDMPTQRLPEFKKVLECFASLKMNWISIEFGAKFPLTGNPLSKCEDRFSREALLELAAYSRRLHIELTPALQVLSHTSWMTFHPDWEKMREHNHKNKHYATVCPQNEQGRHLTQQALEEHIELFKPRRFFVQFDEIGIGGWAKCPKCKEHKEPWRLAGDYLNFTRDILRKHNVAPILCHDCFVGKVFAWKYGSELFDYLKPDDEICYWYYRERMDEAVLGKMEKFKLIGHPLVGMPSNIYAMADAIKQHGGNSMLLTYWYFTGERGTMILPERETPESYGGFVNAADYCWHRTPYVYGEVWYDAVFEFMRRIYPERLTFAPRNTRYTPIDLTAALNCNLSDCYDLPQLNDALVQELKTVCASLSEKYQIVTAPKGKYYGIRVKGKNGGKKPVITSVEIPCNNLKAKGFSFLMASTRAANSQEFYHAQKFGQMRLKHPEVATLTFTYQDGTVQALPLRFRNEVAEWNRPFGGFNMIHSVRGNDAEGRYFSFGTVHFANPYPEKEIVSLSFVSKCKFDISLVLLAMSGWDAENVPAPATAAPKVTYPKVEAPRRPLNIREDFENGMGQVTVLSSSKIRDRVTSEIVKEEVAPGVYNHLLKITIPPTHEKGDADTDGILRVDAALPYPCTADVKTLTCRVRILSEDKSAPLRLQDYLFAKDGRYWYFRMDINSKEQQFYPFGLKTISHKLLTQIEDAVTRKISLFFNPSDKPIELYIDTIGDSSETIFNLGPWRK